MVFVGVGHGSSACQHDPRRTLTVARRAGLTLRQVNTGCQRQLQDQRAGLADCGRENFPQVWVLG